MGVIREGDVVNNDGRLIEVLYKLVGLYSWVR